MKYLFLIILLGLFLTTHAAIYKRIEADGSASFSDKPLPGAEQVDIDPAQTYKVRAINSPKSEQHDGEQQSTAIYEELGFVRPVNNETIRDNAGTVNIELSISPALRINEGHRVVLQMNGKPLGEPANSAHYKIDNLDRGSHSLQAFVIDKKGTKLISSKAISIHVKRHSKLFQRSSTQ
ncbi:MAG: hypothetical protein ACE5EH_00070 [Gammaproteobacteria bacterium]